MRGLDLLRYALVVPALAVALPLAAQAPAPGTPSAVTGPKAKELAELLQAKKLETFAAADESKPNRYVAATLIPGVQLMAVAATYSRQSDITSNLYHKAYQNLYLDLKSGVYSAERFYIVDTMFDGLVMLPPKNAAMTDTAAINGTEHVFDGDFIGSRIRNRKKVPAEAYSKAFADADAQYAHVLDVLITALKKS
jgi:hypothetical protein